MEFITGTVPVNNPLFTETVLVNNSLFTGKIPVKSFPIDGDTVPVNNKQDQRPISDPYELH